MNRWVEEVEHKLPTAFKMALDGGKAGELLLHGQQVLEWTERHCNEFQGYLFAKPMPASDLEKILTRPLMRARANENESGALSASLAAIKGARSHKP